MIRRLLFITMCGLFLMAATVVAEDDGGTESVFTLGAGARAMGMGNAHVAMAEDATTLYYNPAAMSYLSSQEISFLHTIMFQSTIYDFISYVYPYSNKAAFGIAGMRLGTDDIGKRDEFTEIGRFSASHLQLLLSYGRRFDERWSAGMNLKLAHQSIDNLSAYGYGLDLAGHYKLNERFSAGLMLQDIIGARLKLISEKERTPFTLRTGVAYKYIPTSMPVVGRVTFDLEKPEHRDIKIRTGLEVRHENGLSVRGGYDRDDVTLGIGIRYRQFDVDYAYKFVDHLSDSHRFSLIFRFGLTRAERNAKIAEEEKFDREAYLQRTREESMEAERKRAEKFVDDDKPDSALAAYYRALAFADGEDREIIENAVDSLLSSRSEQVVERPETQPEETGEADRAAAIISQVDALKEAGDLKTAREVINGALDQGIDSPGVQAAKSHIELAIKDFILSTNRQADSAFKREDYGDALDKYGRVLAVDDANPTARAGARAARLQIELAQHIKKGLDNFNQGDYLESEREFRAAQQLDPKNATAAEYIEEIRTKLNESETPEERNLRQDDEMWQRYIDGVEAYRAGEYQRAIELWEEILEKYPNDKMTRENIRQARLRVKE